MSLYRVDGDEELVGQFLVGLAPTEQLQQVQFAGGKRLGQAAVDVFEVAEMRADDRVVTMPGNFDGGAKPILIEGFEDETGRERQDGRLAGLAAAHEAVRIDRLRYRNGVGTNVELLDSEAAFTAARQDHVVARYRYLQSITRYQRAAALNTTGTEGNRP